MSLEFDLTSKRERNLSVLKCVNSNVFEIIEDSSHVALYKFEQSQGKWEKVDIEGSAFITRNKESPFYSLIILNKKGPTDFVLDLKSSLKVKVQDVYLMIRCVEERQTIVFGLWFHNDEERTSLYNAMKRITANNESTTSGLTPSLSSLLQTTSLKIKSQKETFPKSATAAVAVFDGVSTPSLESAVKLSYSDILNMSDSNNSNHNNHNIESGFCDDAEPSADHFSVASVPSSTVKSNLLLSALKPSTAVTESTTIAGAETDTSVVKLNVQSIFGGGGGGNRGSSNTNTSSNAADVFSSPSNGAMNGGVSDGSSSSSSSSVSRLLGLLKASGRDSSTQLTAEVALSTSDWNSSSAAVKAVDLSSKLRAAINVPAPATASIPATNMPSPAPKTSTATAAVSAPASVSTKTKAKTSCIESKPEITASDSAEERSVKLLSMLRHATKGDSQSMDLLTDPDIAKSEKARKARLEAEQQQQQPGQAAAVSQTQQRESPPLTKPPLSPLVRSAVAPIPAPVPVPVPVAASKVTASSFASSSSSTADSKAYAILKSPSLNSINTAAAANSAAAATTITASAQTNIVRSASAALPRTYSSGGSSSKENDILHNLLLLSSSPPSPIIAGIPTLMPTPKRISPTASPAMSSAQPNVSTAVRASPKLGGLVPAPAQLAAVGSGSSAGSNKITPSRAMLLSPSDLLKQQTVM